VRTLAAALTALILAPAAQASQLIDRNAAGTRLVVAPSGRAVVIYRAQGRFRRVVAWGATGALAPTRARAQVAFHLDYSGRALAGPLRNTCAPYDGPALHWVVTACTAPDGSYWALQAWQRVLPNYGGTVAPWELRLSHWRGEPATLDIKLDWAYRTFDHLYGTYAYAGRPVFGFHSTALGSPLDGFGRNVYVDTLDSSYGPGWRRENGFLAHNPNGNFCYGFYPHGSHPAGRGRAYRATSSGPGVTPDVFWQSDAPGTYDSVSDRAANDEQRALAASGDSCRPN